MNARLLIVIAALCAHKSGAELAQGGQFHLVSAAIASGGAQSSRANFRLIGTAGQHDAAPALRGGGFRLAPGFWTGITVQQIPDAPILRIHLVTTERVVLSWPITTPGFSMEYSDDLASGQWTLLGAQVVDTADEHQVTVPASGRRCFRLRYTGP